MAKPNKTAEEYGLSRESFKLPEDVVVLQTERHMYRPEYCHKHPIRGYLIDCEEFESTKVKDGKFKGLTVRVTQPTMAADENGNLIPVSPGMDLLIPMTYSLARFEHIAKHPELCAEIMIVCRGKRDIGGGQSLWVYEAGATRTPHSRADVLGQLNFLTPQNGVSELPVAAS